MDEERNSNDDAESMHSEGPGTSLSSLLILPNNGFGTENKSKFSKCHYSMYFDEITNSESPSKRMLRCKVEDKSNKACGELLTMQSSTYINLKRHLKTKHSIVTVGSGPKKSHVQLSFEELKNRSLKYERNHPKQIRFDNNVLSAIANDGLSFNFVHGKGFRKLVRDLDLKIQIKSRISYMKKLRKTVRKSIIPSMKKLLNKLDKRNCHFSCDIWSTRRREGVLGVVAHFIDKNWEIQKKVLSFKQLDERHTANYIRESFADVLAQYDVPKDWGGFVVTDNASNMKKCFDMDEILEFSSTQIEINSEENRDAFVQNDSSSDEDDSEEDLECRSSEEEEDDTVVEDVDECESLPVPIIDGHQTCLAHSLQLGINAALKSDKESKELIKFVHSIMIFFKKSTVYSDMLKKETGLDVTLPCQTRWNATLDMLKKFKDERFFNAVRNVLDKATVGAGSVCNRRSLPRPPTSFQRILSEELHQILRPLGDATDQLQSEKTTSNIVIIAVMNSLRRLRSLTTTNFSNLKLELMKNLVSRMNPYVAKSEYIVASMLDPRQKDGIFSVTSNNCGGRDINSIQLDIPGIDKAKETLRSYHDAETASLNAVLPLAVDSENTQEDSSLFDCLACDNTTPRQSFRNEMDIYLAEALSPKSICPLNFWKVNEARFPILSKLAKKFLAIPATSGGVERVFSITGAIARSRRSKTSIENLSNILLLRQHADL